MLPRTAATAFGVRISIDSPRLLADRDLRQLAHREDGLAAQQHAHEGILRRADLVAPEDVVLELERERRRERGAGDRSPSVQRGDDPDGVRRLGDEGDRMKSCRECCDYCQWGPPCHRLRLPYRISPSRPRDRVPDDAVSTEQAQVQRVRESAARNDTVAPGRSVVMQVARSRICCAPAPELCPRATIRAVVMTLLASGRVPPMQATLLGIQLSGAFPRAMRSLRWVRAGSHSRLSEGPTSGRPAARRTPEMGRVLDPP